MPTGRVRAVATAALLLAAVPLALAHGDGHDGGESMDMQQHPAAPQETQSGAPQSYWSYPDHSSVMFAHIVFEILAWTAVLPIAVMFSIARSRYTLPSQFVFLVLNAFALVLGVVYNKQTPDLYESNSHSKIGWAITWIASAWVVLALIQAYAGKHSTKSADGEVSQPVSAAAMAQYQRVQDLECPNPPRWSDDSGQGTERNSASLFGHSRSPSVESENQQFIGQTRRYTSDEDASFDEDPEKRGFLGANKTADSFLSRTVARFAVGRTLKIMRISYVTLERVIIVLGFVAGATGTVVYGGIARGNHIFNILAHYIKGGIFFGYGLLTLGRWMGAFADLGWAWNVKPPKDVVGRRRAAVPSAEFTESLVIFLYGCTNVFLEHLAAWGGAWTAQDLEHVSISIMFFGGGLLGMIIESRKVREFLNTSVLSSQPPSQYTSDSWQPPRAYKFSFNPMPALVIMLLGKMMGSHHQSSMLSTMVHKQWGTMFMGFALVRGLTYVMFYISPPTSYLPSRPPTEIITSFCLVAGGLTFMISNKDTVAALGSYNLDAMFTLTLTIGLTALVLAWTTVVIALKGWALQKENSSLYAKHSAGVLA